MDVLKQALIEFPAWPDCTGRTKEEYLADIKEHMKELDKWDEVWGKALRERQSTYRRECNDQDSAVRLLLSVSGEEVR